MDALLGRYYKADQPGAAVLVMKEGKVVFKKGYGLAHVELGVPLQPDMVFRIGSVTKQFTAAAVLLLAEEGKVDLQAPVGRYLKDLPAAWEKVTVEQLLNHTSGIPSYTNDHAYMAGMREDLTPVRILERVRAQPLLFEPGTNHRYTNTGYVVLGMLLERLSGKPYGEVLQKRLEAQEERQAIRLDPAIFDPFAGRYELAPGFILTFWREGERFFSQATGQRQVEIFPSSPTRYFLKVVEAEVEFVKDGEGKVTEVVLYQGGRRMPGKRLS